MPGNVPVDSRRLGPPQRLHSTHDPFRKRLPEERVEDQSKSIFDFSDSDDVFETSKLKTRVSNSSVSIETLASISPKIAKPTLMGSMIETAKGILGMNKSSSTQTIDISSEPETEEQELTLDHDQVNVTSIMYPVEPISEHKRRFRFPLIGIVAGKVVAEVNTQEFIPGGEAHILFLRSNEIFLEIKVPDRPTILQPISDMALRLIVSGHYSPDVAYMDLYLNVQAIVVSLLRAGFPGPEVESRVTNLRLFIDLGQDDPNRAMKDLQACCGSTPFLNYRLENHPYEPIRPYQHFVEQERAQNGAPMRIPFSTRTSTRNSGSGASLYSWSGGLNYRNPKPRTANSTYSSTRRIRTMTSDDGDVVVCQPIVPSRGELLFIYPEDSPDGLHMTTVERARLQPGVYLNDNNIDFELRRMYDTLLTTEQQSKTFVFNCFFYKRLSAPKARDESQHPYDRVKTWTKGWNIFELDQLLIPINEALHWYLAIIVNPGYLLTRPLEKETDSGPEAASEEAAESQKDIFAIDLADPTPSQPAFRPGEEGDPDRLQRTYIIILDSLFTNRTSTMTRLKSYLVHEARAKLGVELDASLIRGMTIKDAPRQDNLTDCGCFLLEYAEEAIRHLDTIRPKLILQNHAWFPMEQAKSRRQRMSQVMDEMAQQYRALHPDMHQIIDLGNSSDVEEIANID